MIDSFILIFIIIGSIIIHEYSHAWAADYLGDSTAKDEGRLTLNPLPHIDIFGSILLPFLLIITNAGFIFGWAKPVPFNPYNLRNPKTGIPLVALAGVLSNLLMALSFGLLIRFLPPSNLTLIYGSIVFYNILLAVFNLMPIPPLDGSKVLFPLLPSSFNNFIIFMEKYGIFVLLFFIFYLFPLISPIIFFLFRLFTGVSLPF